MFEDNLKSNCKETVPSLTQYEGRKERRKERKKEGKKERKKEGIINKLTN